MRKTTTKRIRFKGIKTRKIEADFTGGRITSDAGALLLREAGRKTGLFNRFAEAITDQRHAGYVVHKLKTMIAQRIIGIACGYEDGNDHHELRNDPVFKMATNQNPDGQALASPPTLCRLENMVTRQDMVNLCNIMVEQFIASHKTPPQKLILDFGATDDRIHGNQEHAFFHGYYYDYCFLPLYVFCGSQLVLAYLRPSNIDSAKHSWAILSLLFKRFRQVWPKVKIQFRGDGGFCRHRMLDWCDRQGIEYVVGIAGNSRLQGLAKPIIAESQRLYQATREKVRRFGEVSYGAQSWKYPRRVIVKAEQLEQGENLRFLVTNLTHTPKYIYDGCYVQRGDMENRIKEQQLDLFADRTSCTRFLSNQFRLLLSSAAYLLLDWIRRNGLRGTLLAQAQCQTIRLKLLKIGASIVMNTRRIHSKMSSYYPYQDLFSLLARRLT